jgi:hypothetical protein
LPLLAKVSIFCAKSRSREAFDLNHYVKETDENQLVFPALSLQKIRAEWEEGTQWDMTHIF